MDRAPVELTLPQAGLEPPRCDTEGEPVFVDVPRLTDEAMQAVLHKIIIRLMKLLTRKGVLVEEQNQTYMAEDDSDSDAARERNPARWSGTTRDWSPIGAVTLNPERDSVVADHSKAELRQPMAA